jgi:hypothetical protein
MMTFLLFIAAVVVIVVTYAYGVKHGMLYGIDLCRAELAKQVAAVEKVKNDLSK